MSDHSLELKALQPGMDTTHIKAYKDEEEGEHLLPWVDPPFPEKRMSAGLLCSHTTRRFLLVAAFLLCTLLAFWVGRNGASVPNLDNFLPHFLESELSSSRPNVALGSSDTVPKLDRMPPNTRIVGLVFYGRPIFMDILDCYLRKNLRQNGGVLDEIRFILHTQSKVDITWLEDLVKRDGLQDQYKLLYEEDEQEQGLWDNGGHFSNLWGKFATDDDTLYVKIDDDIIYVDDAAVPRMVNSLLAHPEAYSIQSNIVNSRFTHWFHHTTGAILPFLPDPSSQRPDPPAHWHPSALSGYPISTLDESDSPVVPHYTDAGKWNPQWLPLPRTTHNLLRTPFTDGSDLPDPKTGAKDPAPRWPLAAQEHYSFMANLEEDRLSAYWFGRADDGLWNTWFQHYNVNFMAFWGRTIALRPFWNESDPATFVLEDELALTMDVPRELRMPVLVDTRAVVSHFAFHGSNQRRGLLKTELLDRYRLLANDRACAAGNQKVPLRWKRGEGYVLAGGEEIHDLDFESSYAEEDAKEEEYFANAGGGPR